MFYMQYVILLMMAAEIYKANTNHIYFYKNIIDFLISKPTILKNAKSLTYLCLYVTRTDQEAT